MVILMKGILEHKHIAVKLGFSDFTAKILFQIAILRWKIFENIHSLVFQTISPLLLKSLRPCLVKVWNWFS